MSDFLKLSGMALLAALLSSILDKRDRAFAMGLGLLTCTVVLYGCIKNLAPVANIMGELSVLSGLGNGFLEPLVKTAGIGVVTQIACGVCTDCGQNALAKVAELCGTVAAICMSMPLLSSALELLQQMMEG